MSVDIYLTEEFAKFSQKIAELQSKKKAKEMELKEIYEKGKAELLAINEEANKLSVAWHNWATSKNK